MAVLLLSDLYMILSIFAYARHMLAAIGHSSRGFQFVFDRSLSSSAYFEFGAVHPMISLMSSFCSVPMHLHARLSPYVEQSGRDDLRYHVQEQWYVCISLFHFANISMKPLILPS